MPRLRQAVLVARELEPVVADLHERLGLGEPYRDPELAYFGMVNAVFAIGDTFLEVVCPVQPEIPGAATAARRLERSGLDVCGYMAMFQVDELGPARERVAAAGVREVFAVELDEIVEVHLHPGDMRAIVALSQPRPPSSWRWGGAGWSDRSVPGRVAGVVVASVEPVALAERWRGVAGGPLPECTFVAAAGSPPDGIVEIAVEVEGELHSVLTG
jgi:glyoxalase-like protein